MPELAAILRDASLRDAPQDEAFETPVFTSLDGLLRMRLVCVANFQKTQTSS
jgi:hypothetical protein